MNSLDVQDAILHNPPAIVVYGALVGIGFRMGWRIVDWIILGLDSSFEIFKALMQ